jgi:hypothetical protein
MDTDSFDELVGDGLEPAERARLQRTDALLRTAGPPPELPPALRVPPGSPPPADVVDFPRGLPGRRWAAYGIAAAALAIAAFGGGYLVAHNDTPEAFGIDFVLPMQGTAAAPQARASLAVGEIDDAGNWPMRMTVQGLPRLANGEGYELWLSRHGKPIKPCGTFVVSDEGRTVVALNAPYKLKNFDGWVVTRHGSQKTLLETV